MKKIIFIAIIFALSLSACGALENSLSEKHVKEMETRISKLEADVLNIQFNSGKIKEERKPVSKPIVEELPTVSYVEEKAEEIVVAPKPVPKVFEISEPKEGSNLTVEPITFTGIIDPSATKISVKYTGVDLSEEYTLKNFKTGDKTFWYKAASSFKNLAKGKNTYEFKAEFSDGDVVVLEPIVINYK